MKKSKQLVFIDDSGDPGFKHGVSSTNFILAAALFMDTKTAILVDNAFSDFRHSLGWREDYEFKFAKIRKDIVLKLLENIVQYNFQIYAVYINKTSYPDLFQFRLDYEKIYNWATKELLAIMPLKEARVKIDGKYGKQYRLHVKAYIRKELNTEIHQIANFDIVDSKKDNLIQLADIIAGSINRSFQTNKTDSQNYINVLKRKIVELKELDLNKND